MRTPGQRGAVRARQGQPCYVDNQVRAYMHQGYIIVRQDVRGRYMSEGPADVRPVIVARKSNRDIDESTDTYDTAEWLVHNVPFFNNGNIGVRGTSVPGFLLDGRDLSALPRSRRFLRRRR